MRRRRKTQELIHKASAVLMILAMFWLTISIAFTVQLNTSQTISAGIELPAEDAPDDNTNPYGNNTEEKAPSGNNSITEDYLHHNDYASHLPEDDIAWHKSEDDGDYIAYHGELLVPPPNA